MESLSGMVFWLLVGIAGVLLVYFILEHLSPEGRKRRRRRRNHTPVITTVRRPMVKFCVRSTRARPAIGV